jgi:hypothetical protein
MLVPSLLIVTFFRHIRQRHPSRQVSSMRTTPSQLRRNETTVATKNKRKNERLFPWWCLFIAYGFSFVLIGMSIVLILARGIEFGDTKVHKWLTSMIVGFFSSILLSQPIKVCLIRTMYMS